MSLHGRIKDSVEGRVLPRRLAPLLIGSTDIAIGVARATDPHAHLIPSYAYALHWLPIDIWGMLFIVTGILVICGMLNNFLAWLSASVAFAFWVVWADLIYQTVGDPRVARAGIVVDVCLAFLHTMLMPYRRRKEKNALALETAAG